MSGRARGANYRAAEDKALCEAWIEVSSDGGTGVNQSGDEFYGRVKAVFDEFVEDRQISVQEQAATSLNSRFSTISASVSKFVGCHGRVSALNQSGRALSDIEHQAVELYESSNGRFRFLQCRKVLKDSDKWGAWRSGIQDRHSPNKRSRAGNCPPADETTQLQEDMEPSSDTIHTRPIGLQRAKLDRANLALYARQVNSTERMAKNEAIRNQVAQEQVELNLFSMRPDDGDEETKEFVALKRRIVLAHLRKKVAALEISELTPNDLDPGITRTADLTERVETVAASTIVDPPTTADTADVVAASTGVAPSSTANNNVVLPHGAEILHTF